MISVCSYSRKYPSTSRRREYIIDFIGRLGPGNWGSDLPISDFILRSRLAEEDLNLIRDTLKEWSDGSFHLGLSATL